MSLCAVLAIMLVLRAGDVARAQTLNLWPGVAPGSEQWTQKEITVRDTPVGTVVLDVVPAIPAKLPPIFMAWAQDDALAGSSVESFYRALEAANDTPEVHVFSTGGHGFGVKRQGTSSDHWLDDFFGWLQAAGFVPDSAPSPLVIGETFTIHSRVLGETRRINVYAPPAYSDSPQTALPVLYMPDGGMGEDFLHVAGLVQVSVGNGTMRPFLLVGIENTERRRDLTGPTENEEDRKIAPRVGGSAAFRTFIRDELMPVVRARYRTTGETAIVGESLAGLFVVESFFVEPDLFDTYIAFDPSLWWNDARLVAEAPARLRAAPGRTGTLYLASSSEPVIAKETRRLAKALEANAPPGLHWYFESMPEETHATIYHPAALRAFRTVLAPADSERDASHARSQTPRWLTLPEPPPMPRPDTAVLVAGAEGAILYAAVFHRGGPAPVLLLHGGLSRSDVWAAEVARLAPTHEVIVMDARGHGRSTLGSLPLSYSLLEADAVSVLDALHLQRSAVVGWSDGGIAGLLLAIDHPDRIAGLLTYGANFDRSGYVTTPPDSQIVALGRRYMARAEAAYRRLSPTPEGFPALRAALEALYDREPNIAPAALRSIRVPTTIAAGDHEQFIARAHTERLAALIPGARLVIMPDVSHGGPLQDPDGFHQVVEEFLATVRY